MHVRAYGAGGDLLAEWRGAAFFYGDLPVRYVADGSPLRWDDPDAESIKIDSDAVGASGKTLSQWAPRGTRRIVVDIAARGAGQGAADDAAMGPEGNGAGSEARSSVPRSGWDELFDTMVARQAGSEEGVLGGDSGPGSSRGPEQGQGRGHGQAQEGVGNGSATGSERGVRWGHARGSDSPSWVPGGVPGVEAGGRIGDPEHGKPWGRAGGDPGAEGHIDGPGIVGILDVPDDIAPLVNAAVTVGDANLAGLGHKLLRQAIEGMAERILREQIEREARRMARAGLGRVARRLDLLEKYKHLSTPQRRAILGRAEAAMERAYRKRVAQHARSQAEEYERVVAQLEGKLDDQSAHLRTIARENAEGYRKVEAAAGNHGANAHAQARDGSTATASRPGEQSTSQLVYEVNPKHTAVRRGQVSAAPRDGQTALANSVRVKETSTRRVGVDSASGEIVVFDEHLPGRFHGHVRSWEELTPAMQHALEQAGLATRRGRIIED